MLDWFRFRLFVRHYKNILLIFYGNTSLKLKHSYNSSNSNVDSYKEYDKCTPLFIDTDCCKPITQKQKHFDSCNNLSLYPYGYV